MAQGQPRSGGIQEVMVIVYTGSVGFWPTVSVLAVEKVDK